MTCKESLWNGEDLCCTVNVVNTLGWQCRVFIVIYETYGDRKMEDAFYHNS